jgi:nicotinate phosphoribosyltransferase
VFPWDRRPELEECDRVLPVPLLREGQLVGPPAALKEARDRVRASLATVPWEGLRLSPGDPAIPTIFH